MSNVMYVLIVDDSVIASGRLRLMLEELEGVTVVGQAGGDFLVAGAKLREPQNVVPPV